MNFTEETFRKLIEAPPEPLVARLKISHALLLNLLQRDQDTGAALRDLIDATTSDAGTRRALVRRAVAVGRSLLAAGVVVRLDEPTAGGRRHQLAVDLQHDFALNQPLSAFALAALGLLDPEAPDYALDAVSVIESTLEDPRPVLVQQQFKARGEAVAELKADGVEYEERLEVLDGVTWPQAAGRAPRARLRGVPRHPPVAGGDPGVAEVGGARHVLPRHDLRRVRRLLQGAAQ